MRGTPLSHSTPPLLFGLIPTYAGNTRTCAPVQGQRRAHPHVCGEHPSRASPTAKPTGSSPRMRGTRGHLLFSPRCVGLIPTYAGNTTHPAPSPPRLWAHPHVCGEHIPVYGETENPKGSSPRMRGTRRVGRIMSTPTGLIPTYAGNTFWYHLL